MIGYIVKYPDGMTVTELKKLIKDWPETDRYGDPCEVWVCDRTGLTNQVSEVSVLNRRADEDKEWADILLTP